MITIEIDPDLADFESLRAFIAHRIDTSDRTAKSIARSMGITGGTLSRKLKPRVTDTQRFNVDDLELYIQKTGDTACIEYLASKYLESNEARRLRMLSRAEQMLPELAKLLSAMQEAR